MTHALQNGLDYRTLSPVEREILTSAISRINGFVRTSAQVYLEIGITLKEVQERFDHGFFAKWAAQELPWSYSTTRKLIYIANSFEGRNVEGFQTSALYLLSWPNVPQQAREYAFERVSEGHEITKQEAKEIILRHQQPQPMSRADRIQKAAAQVREDEAAIRMAAGAWSNLEKIVNESRTVHISRNEDSEFGDVTYTVVNYPDDDSKSIGSRVRRNLDDAVASAAGNEAKKRCYLCRKYIEVSQFTYLATSKDKRSRACRECENARGRKQKEKRKARRKVLAA